jgi:hypothetical protein
MQFQRVATFKKVLSNTFQRKREGSPSSSQSSQSNMTLPYFTFTPTVGRNSVTSSVDLGADVDFCWLMEEQRDELGGVEYRAVKMLLIVLLCMSSCFG